MWRHGKKFFSLLAVLFFLSVGSSWADVTLTETEYQELMILLTTQETALETQQTTIKNLENELKQAKSLQETQGETIKLLLTQIDALKKSLKMPSLGVEFGGMFNLDDGPGVYAGISLEF